MDEPLNVLDIDSQNKAISILKQYVENTGRAIIFSSHIDSLISELATREMILINGSLVSI